MLLDFKNLDHYFPHNNMYRQAVIRSFLESFHLRISCRFLVVSLLHNYHSNLLHYDLMNSSDISVLHSTVFWNFHRGDYFLICTGFVRQTWCSFSGSYVMGLEIQKREISSSIMWTWYVNTGHVNTHLRSLILVRKACISC